MPTLTGGTKISAKSGVLFEFYGEVCIGWQTLTDARFKLLGFVMNVSVIVLINILVNTLARDDPSKELSPITCTRVIVFSFLIALVPYIYNRRNSQLYDDLVSHGRCIEEELGIDTGQFRGRQKSPNWLIQHDVATNLIYGTALIGWLFALLATWLGWN